MAKVKAVPEGYGTITPFLNIKGAAQAVELYKDAFGAEERIRLTLPDGKLAMSELKIGSSIVRISDSVEVAPTRSAAVLYVEDADKWWKRAVGAGMKQVLPLEDRFFGDRFGILEDRYGNRWSIATHIKDVPIDELKRHAAEAAEVR